jgi:GTP:adenosylcobinamide-phosphate guanylyltransferase
VDTSGLYDAIVLAGRRPGEDPFAAATGVAHRALIPVAGEPMLERVLAILRRHPRIGSIRISIDRPELLAAGDAAILRSADSPSTSVLEALESRALATAGRPVLLTTADHALLDDAILDAFLDGADASGADIAVGLVRERLLRDAFPDSERTYLRFRDGGVSGANLFALRTPAARLAVEFWRRVESLRKQPLRLVAAFGPLTLLLFALRLLSLEGAFARASKKLGVRARPVALPYARAAIDIDKPADLALVERILAGDRPG